MIPFFALKSRSCILEYMQSDDNNSDTSQSSSWAESQLSRDQEKKPIVTLTPDDNFQAIQQDVTAPNDPMVIDEPVRWQAQEYINQTKTPLWFALFAISLVAFMALAIFVMQSISFAILLPVMAAALLVYIRRPPRIINYTLSRKGLYINEQLYSFSEFKSFGVIHDGKEYSVMLIPLKRFRPGVSVYFPEVSGEAIVDMLGAHLPMEELHLDLVDQLLRKLRI